MKKKMLLHSCCGPCSTSVIDRLKEEYDLTIFYYNPNIYPREEYQKRLAEQQKYVSLIGLDINSIDLYNYYKVSNSLMNIDEELRVIEKTIKIESPEDSTVQVGEKFDDIKKYQLSVSKTANEVKEVQNKLNNTIATVVKVENNVVQIGSSVGEIEDGLIGTNGNVTEIVNTLNILSNIVLSNTENITEVQGDIVIANEKIETVNQEIETIKLEIVDINSKLDEILSKLN